MERILLLHSRLLLTSAALLALLLCWGLVCAARGRLGRPYLAGLSVAALLLLAEGALGAILLVAGGRAVELALHSIYGIVAALCLPAALAYNRGRSGRWEALIFAAVCLFLLVLLARAAATAG